MRASLAPSPAGGLPSPAAFAVVLAAGLATSLSPCTLSMLPLTIGYIAGAEARDRRASGGATAEAADEGGDGTASPPPPPPPPPPPSSLPRAAAFAAGFATTLAAGGVAAAAAGRVYVGAGSLVGGGSSGGGGSSALLAALLPLAGSGVAIVMGLNLLGALALPALPGWDVDGDVLAASLSRRGRPVPAPLRAYAAGAAFALAASPCATPVLATLLAYTAAAGGGTGAGGALLATYALGYTAPLLAAAAGAGALARVVGVRERSGWVPTAAGGVLVAGGVYGLLSRLVPPP